MHLVEDKKTALSLKVRPELKRGLDAHAKAEKRSAGNLGEVLLEWSFEQLQAAGDTVTLMRSPGVPKSRRISLETQEQLFTALKIIIERAPSPVIEEVTRKLEAWAGKFGAEKN